MPSDNYFTCTGCNEPCNHVTTAYSKGIKKYVWKGERLCDSCFGQRKRGLDSIISLSKEEKQELIKQLRL
jgi:hypothetical protein